MKYFVLLNVINNTDGESQSTWRKSCPGVSLFTTNPAWTGQGWKLGLCNKRPANKPPEPSRILQWSVFSVLQRAVPVPHQSLCAEMTEELCFALRCRGSRQRPALKRQCSKCMPGTTYVPAVLDLPPHPPTNGLHSQVTTRVYHRSVPWGRWFRQVPHPPSKVEICN